MTQQIFEKPQINNVADFISTNREPFLNIPRYQRMFTWNNDHRTEFLDDVMDDLREYVNDDNTVQPLTFIGNVIVHSSTIGKRGNELSLNGVNNMPLYSIVDGQQRLTLITLVAIILYDYIKELEKKDDNPKWVENWVETTLIELEKIFLYKRQTRTSTINYPRIIREHQDKLNPEQKLETYKSPISRFVIRYVTKSLNIDDTVTEGMRNINDKKYTFYKAVKEIKKKIVDLINKNYIHNIERIVKQENIIDALRLQPFEETEISLSEQQKKLIKAIFYGNYILTRVYFVSVITEEESYAFDIFQSLNTRGQNLTAYETFKPEVINQEQDKYADSESKEYIDDIDKFLESTAEEKRENITVDMILAFAVLMSGEKLSKSKINKQRKYLNTEYNKYIEVGNQRKYLSCIKYISDLMRIENKKRGYIEELFEIQGSACANSNLFKEAMFCLDFIKKSNHTICRAIITRFYIEAYEEAEDVKQARKFKEFLEIIRVTAAFFAILRGSGNSTSKVEKYHRKLMEEYNYSKNSTLDLNEIKRKMREFIGEIDISNAEEWINKTTSIPIYEQNKTTAKFLIMVASERCIEDDDNPGCIKLMISEDYKKIIDEGTWGHEIYKTIEHIAPQKRQNNSGYNIQDDQVNCLGNLILLPQSMNTLLSNHGWKPKNILYKAAGSKLPEELNNIKNEWEEHARKSEFSDRKLKQINAYFSKRWESIPMARTLGKLQEFDEEIIKKRHQNIIGLAWNTLAIQWLGFDEATKWDGNYK